MVTVLASEKKDTTGFGKRLRALREAAQLTQQEVADRSRMRHQNVARLERGDRTPSWETVLKLARALNVSVADFDDDPDDKPAKKKPKK